MNTNVNIKLIKRRDLYRGIITADEIIKAYQDAFGIQWWHKYVGLADFQLADETYFEANREEIKKVLEQDQIDKEIYKAEEFDCDNYSFALMGSFHHNRETAPMPIFITWVLTREGGHALLSFYEAGKVFLIEPQTDEIIPGVPADWALILLCG